MEPSFGGINLEDIEKPKCFHVLEKAREQLNIPVWHDDQQGTATVILAGLINSFKIVGKKPQESLITLVGSGAANIRTAYVLMQWGIKPGNIILADSKGVVHKAEKTSPKKKTHGNMMLHRKLTLKAEPATYRSIQRRGCSCCCFKTWSRHH